MKTEYFDKNNTHLKTVHYSKADKYIAVKADGTVEIFHEQSHEKAREHAKAFVPCMFYLVTSEEELK